MTRRTKDKTYDATPRQKPIPFGLEIGAVLAPLDQTANEMETKWGFDRLPALVSEQTALRFAGARQDLDNALEQGDFQAISETAANLRRGWAALDAEATAAGQQPFDPLAWGFMVGTMKAAVVRDAAAQAEVQKACPDTQVWTLSEIGNLLAALFKDQYPTIAKAKELFPGATVSVRDTPPPPVTDTARALQDQIPF